MAIANYAVIENGTVTNVIVWDGNTDVDAGGWVPPEGCVAVLIEPPADIGWAATQGSNGAWTFSAPAA
ncbi:hypothetical protein [Burkholderia anthina]|uniref:hypothetical protein n=1 Tax=Burkholderia anthina TaxID=179879 RepID=UPI001AA011F8|nr:hypothetical protein [Burkholderia anthina]QTD88728.1 hypothetical protein J4G50_12955 [Burkholderia anthina]